MTAAPDPAQGTSIAGGSGLRLFLLSAFLLLLEVANIRWIAGHVPVVGYYANLVLISTFFGFGFGCLYPAADAGGRKALDWDLRIIPFLLLVLVGAVVVLGRAPVALGDRAGEMIWASTPGATVHLWGGLIDSFRAVLQWIQTRSLHLEGGHRFLPVEAIVLFFFTLNAGFFFPVGREIGRQFRVLPLLRAYTINIAGSLAGVLAMFAFSSASLPPLWWYGTALGILAFIGAGRGTTGRIAAVGAGVLFLTTVTLLDESCFWSPYSRIRIHGPAADSGKRDELYLAVGEHFHQNAQNLASPDFTASPPRFSVYDVPYHAHRDTTRRVLILGAGTGNDITAALHADAEVVHAVEIDPTIQSLGRRLHPNDPYGDPRVTAILDDGRRFLRRSTELYDVIAWGMLDSHNLFSNFSSVRLDSFIYTEEGLAAAARRLAPGGLAVITYASVTPWLGTRLLTLARRVFGRAEAYSFVDGYVILAGPGLADPAPDSYLGASRLIVEPSPDLHPTDDWPFLYLASNRIPGHYLVVIVVILTACMMLAGGRMRRGRFAWPFFWLGAGFLLLETVSVTRCAVLFGATWVVNALVFSAVLTGILAANALTARIPAIAWRLGLALLPIGLAIAAFVPPELLLGASPLVLWAGGSLVSGLPLFGASLIFARLIRDAPDGESALGANLVGAVAGGFLEYLSMVFGFSALFALAAVCYALALGTALRPRQRI